MAEPVPFVKDENHWLFRLSPAEWISAALGEVSRAEKAYDRHDGRAGLLGSVRAAGMACNGALIVEPNAVWGRTYVEHVKALSVDPDVPEGVRIAALTLVEAKPPTSALAMLRTKSGDARVLEAARDVIAHAYVVVTRAAARPG